MASVRCLLASLALAIVASARVEAGLYTNCRDLAEIVSSSDVPINDSTKVLAKAKWYLLTVINPSTLLDRSRLISAWDKVIHERECSSSSFDEVAVIARCSPKSDEGLKTLAHATRSYARDCLTPEYVGEKIVSNAAGAVSNTFYGDARKFIDSQFIENYRANNRDEPPIHLGTKGGDNCCEPERAISAIKNAIERNLQKSDKTMRGEFTTKEQLSSYLKKHLFKPCDGYRKALRDLLSDLSAMGNGLIAGGADSLIGRMSREVQDDVFRYNLCENMLYAKRYKKLVEQVFKSI